METVDLEMEDIFDGGVEEEDLAVPPPLPDLDDDMPGGSGQGEDGGTLNTDNPEAETSATKVAIKKRVMRPQPKLDVERLQSERGLPMLPKLFKNTKFKGKGHEADDLKLVMGRLEHWAHRLFPKLTFDDFVARLEKLGHTKPVQTCIKRIRLDMPITAEDFTGNRDEGSGNEDNAAGGSSDAPRGSAMDVDEAYEEMLQQERQQMTQQKAATPGGTSPNQLHTSAAGSASDEPCPMPSTSAEMSPPIASSSGLSPRRTPQSRMTGSQASMTPEQLARIERNKQLAMEKRAARLGVSVASLQSPKPTAKVTGDALTETTSDGDNMMPAKAKKATPDHQSASSVAVTTDVEMNTNEPDSSDVQTRYRNGTKSSEDREVMDDTDAQDKSNNNDSKRTPDGDTMNTEQIMDALESDHDNSSDVSVAKGDSPVRDISALTKCTNDTSKDVSPDLQTSDQVLMNGGKENVSDKTMPGKATENQCREDECEKRTSGKPPSKPTLLSTP